MNCPGLAISHLRQQSRTHPPTRVCMPMRRCASPRCCSRCPHVHAPSPSPPSPVQPQSDQGPPLLLQPSQKNLPTRSRYCLNFRKAQAEHDEMHLASRTELDKAGLHAFVDPTYIWTILVDAATPRNVMLPKFMFRTPNGRTWPSGRSGATRSWPVMHTDTLDTGSCPPPAQPHSTSARTVATHPTPCTHIAHSPLLPGIAPGSGH